MQTETTGKTPRKASKMYGNKPPAARRLAQFPQQLADGGMGARMKSASTTQPQRLADGGFVSAAKRMMGLTPEDPARAARLAEYKANAEREKAAAKAASAQATAPAPQAAISQYSGMSAMQRREKEQGLADGGMIRGPGTGTSDSISTEAEPGTFIMPADSTKAIGPRVLEQMGKKVPVRLSNGEYEIPPEQVMGIGAAVLELMKESTHEAAEDVDEGESGDRVAQMLASGGMVENDVTRVGNSYSGGNVGGNITVNGAPTAGTFNENPASRMGAMPTPPAAPAPLASAAPSPAPQTAAAPAAAPAAPMGWAERNAQRSNQVTASSILDSPERRAAQTALMPAPVAAPAPVAPPTAAQRFGTLPALGQPAPGEQPRRYADGGTVEDDLQKRLSQIPIGGPVGWTGGGQSAAQSSIVPAPPTAAAHTPAGALSRAASYLPPTMEPALAPPRVTQTLGTEPRPKLSDATDVSGQDVGAAQGVARSGAADALANLPNAPEPIRAPAVRHSGNDWASRNALRNAEVSASSITNNGGRFDQTGGRNPAALAYQSAVATDNALQASEPGLAAAAMKENSETNRSAMRDRSVAAQSLASERGAMDRTLITERGNNARAGIAALGLTESARIKAQQEGKAPTGYRYTAGGNMEAIPGGPADLRQNKEGVQQGKDTQDIFSILNEARPLLSNATGSYAGVAADKAAQTFGIATDGAKATAQLKALQGALVSKMPKMSGPQSDKDVQLYREMAGQIGDPTIPVEQRKAAMGTIENLNMKYLPAVADAAGYEAVPSGAYYKTAAGDVRRKQ